MVAARRGFGKRVHEGDGLFPQPVNKLWAGGGQTCRVSECFAPSSLLALALLTGPFGPPMFRSVPSNQTASTSQAPTARKVSPGRQESSPEWTGRQGSGGPARPVVQGGDGVGRLLGTLRLAPKPLGSPWSLRDPGERPEWLEDNALITGHGRLRSGPSGCSGLSLFPITSSLRVDAVREARNFPAWPPVGWE